MSQFPGDKSSEFLAGTLGGPGYGEFPLGSAGPRVDTSDPRYRAPPQPGGGFFDEMFDRLPPGPVLGLPPTQTGGGFPIARRIPDDRMPQPAPGNGGIFDKLFPRRNPQPSQQMPTPGAGNLFARPDTAGYDQKLSDYMQQQYRNAPSPYEQQAEFLMNRPVFDRGARPDDPMMTFQRPETQDPIAMMAGQQPLRDAANAAANKAQQDQLAAQEAAANQAAADARTLEEAAAAQAEQERIAVEKAAADAAAMQEAERIAAEEIQQRAAEAAAAQAEAGAQAAAAQAAAEAESIALAKAAEDQRLADLQERLAALDGRFGGFEGRFGGFDPATVQANIAAAAKAAEAAKATAAANTASFEGITPDIQARIDALQGQLGGFGGILDGFDPAAMQANIAAAQAAAATNAATIAGTPSVDPGLQARIDAMQGELGGFGRRFEGFDPAAIQANIAAAKAAADTNAAAIAETPAVNPGLQARIDAMQGELGNFQGRFEGFDPADLRARIEGLGIGGEGGRMRGATSPGFVAPTDRTVQKSREGVVGRNLGGMDNDAIRARIAALGAGTPPAPAQQAPDFQSNVDLMNQMAAKSALVGSEGQAVAPKFSYDPATNEYVQDASAFGFTGDSALTQYSPEEFQQKFGSAMAEQRAPAPAPAPAPVSDRIGTLGGTGYGEFPLGSAGPRAGGQSNPAPSPKTPQIDPSSLFSDPGLGGGRATPLPKTRVGRTVKTPPPPKAPQPPRSGPKPKPSPKPKPKAPLSPRSGPKPKVISDPAKEKAKPKAMTYPRRGKGQGR